MGNCLPIVFGSHRSQNSQPSSSAAAAAAAASYSNPLVFPNHSAYVNNLVSRGSRGGLPSDHSLPSDENAARVRALLAHMPPVPYSADMGKGGDTECAICMSELQSGKPVRFLPCMHVFHCECVDDWLLRSFSCPSCLEPVDSTLLSSLTAHQSLRLADLACSPATS